jgi:nucleotide-binding universal stress UspA family protein
MTATKVLFATDFSPASDAALVHAEAYARQHGHGLLIVHVVDALDATAGEGMLHDGVRPDVTKIAERRLNDLARSIEGIACEWRILKGEPARGIVELAKSEPVVLIAVGTHGRSGLKRVLMGSVAEHIVRNAACPVLTIRTADA